MKRFSPLLACFILVAPLAWMRSDERSSSRVADLTRAMAEGDIERVRAVVARTRAVLGEKAGEPEVADEFRAVPVGATLLTRAEAQRGFAPLFGQLEKMRWWKVGANPAEMKAPLREVASVISGQAAAARARLDGAERGLAMAKEAADFLVWAQEQAGAGCYPFPAACGTSRARAMEVASRFLAQAEKAGRLSEVARNGWVFEDLGDGGLQFDNGECGVAMIDLHAVTGEQRYLDSARRAADWALSRPLCANWNYNSFSVRLLARAYAATGDPRYLDAAVSKARLGMIPGQLADGARAGRWVDPHNARPAYHYIMMAALAQLVGVLPPSHQHRPEILRALSLGLAGRNAEMTTRGVMNKDHAMETLLLVKSVFADDPAYRLETNSEQALRSIGLLVSAEARRGRQPLAPGPWGMFLENIVATGQ
ncbi:MAG: hypothetical protein ACKOE8_12350 [Opitutaceae bacterium]